MTDQGRTVAVKSVARSIHMNTATKTPGTTVAPANTAVRSGMDCTAFTTVIKTHVLLAEAGLMASRHLWSYWATTPILE
jgi:hypothetical protein